MSRGQVNNNRQVAKRNDQAIDRILEVYNENPVVRALINIAIAPVPYGIGSALDAALTAKIEQIRADRLKVFFDELASGAVSLTPDIIETEEFLHSYFCTLKAAVNERRREKIRMFARLLLYGTLNGFLGDDIFEENIRILDQLSIRQLEVMHTLFEFESKYPVTPGVTGDRLNEYWKDFEAVVNRKYDLKPRDLKATLLQLMALGFYEKYDRAIAGKLTPTVEDFLEWIEAMDSSSVQPEDIDSRD